MTALNSYDFQAFPYIASYNRWISEILRLPNGNVHDYGSSPGKWGPYYTIKTSLPRCILLPRPTSVSRREENRRRAAGDWKGHRQRQASPNCCSDTGYAVTDERIAFIRPGKDDLLIERLLRIREFLSLLSPVAYRRFSNECFKASLCPFDGVVRPWLI